MKPALIIDFDGTLCHDRFWRSSPPAVYEKIQSYLFSKQAELIDRWIHGEYTSEEINQHLSNEFGLDYETLWNLFVSDCKTMRVETSNLEKVSALREKYTTILMTDNMDCFSRFTAPSLKLTDYFDTIVNSYNEKRFKNDAGGKLFVDVLARYTAPVSKSILIDNSKPTCELFENLDGTSLFITPEKPLAHWLCMLLES